uniref:Uncharacterized protein n=1 Tax=Rhizophora mucronata TaxID=61149 RepID=A0A2P2Q4M3_RHIMU
MELHNSGYKHSNCDKMELHNSGYKHLNPTNANTLLLKSGHTQVGTHEPSNQDGAQIEVD